MAAAGSDLLFHNRVHNLPATHKSCTRELEANTNQIPCKSAQQQKSTTEAIFTSPSGNETHPCIQYVLPWTLEGKKGNTQGIRPVSQLRMSQEQRPLRGSEGLNATGFIWKWLSEGVVTI